ncbi:AAA family ATPase [Mycolicibacterium palauense]|uniref:AAA family ATPase n=1 Tax=Mycolicibacterium palauense TaxID=2034511 RepID=UPI000BFEC44F|nr:AAA family ATPase [Mycolicibacterium palauense]
MPIVALIGRDGEQQVLAELLDGARRGRSGVLVVRGEAGIGKTALLATLVDGASDFRVLHVSGAELEMELVYSGVQQLCAPLLDLLGRLPHPQAHALGVALGHRSGAAPDRLLVGLAVLTLLAEAGGGSPVLCVIDDAQWVDSSSVQAMALVARRLQADPVVMVFATRNRESDDALAGQRELALEGLADHDARLLLATMVPGRLNERVRETVLAEANGNPLALLELHKALTPEGLAGGYGLAAAASTETQIERTFVQQLLGLPAETRMLLLVVAADPAGRPEWIWSAIERLGIGRAAAQPAEAAGLIVSEAGPRFRHPLIRAAIYRSSSPSDRRRAHAALASSIAGSVVEDYRSWHRAHAAEAPDAQIADELERSAARARARGGVSAAAAFLEYAASLTPDPTERVRRALDAAMASLDAGMTDAAARLVSSAYDGTDDELSMARCELIRAKMAFAVSRGVDAPPLLLAAAKRLETLDPLESRKTYLGAVLASILVGRMSDEQHNSAPSVAEAARGAPPAPDPPRAVDLLLDGLIVRLTRGYAPAARLLRDAIGAYLNELRSGVADARWHDLTVRICLDLFDQDAYNFLTAREVEELRAAGALTMLPVALVTSAGICVSAGKFEQADALLDESAAIITATGAPLRAAIKTYLAAYRGQEQLCRSGVQETIEGAVSRGEGYDISVARFAAAVLHNGLGQYQEALEAAASGARYDDPGMCGYLLVELVEAAVRCREAPVAAEALQRLLERATVSGTDTALGVAARSSALVADGPAADAAYREAITHLQNSPAVVYLARTHLVYGEWLRRVKRRAEARRQLRIAHDMFAEMGAEGFALRARRELAATGETIYARPPETVAALTTQESRIARLARDGLTNTEIAEHLFLSHRTVEWHLGKVFAKLGVTSRRELRIALQEQS